LAFTRNPSDTSVSPATYTADGASDLLLVDQVRDIAIDGSDKNDLVFVSASALASNALYDYNVRGFAGNDNIDFRANLIQDSTINGNIGNDTMSVGFFDGNLVPAGITNLTNSYFLGGKGDDTVTGYGLNNGEVNGNIGDDVITVDNIGVVAGFNMYIGGGQGNDLITVGGDYVGSIIDGNKGTDTIDVVLGDHKNSSVNGGEGDDIIRSVVNSGGLNLNGDKGNDTIVGTGAKASTITGGEGSDTILSASLGGESSLVDGGVGADFIGLETVAGVQSVGVETVVFNTGDSVAATKTSFQGTKGAAGKLATGDKITFGNKVDYLTNADAKDKIDIDFTPDDVIVANNADLIDTLLAGEIYEVKGAYNTTTNVFEVNAAGTEGLYIIGGSNLSVGQVFTNSTNILISDTLLSNFV